MIKQIIFLLSTLFFVTACEQNNGAGEEQLAEKPASNSYEKVENNVDDIIDTAEETISNAGNLATDAIDALESVDNDEVDDMESAKEEMLQVMKNRLEEGKE